MQAAPYTHATAPHAVASRTKYREPMDDENAALANNIMYDKRVVRGNTYAAQILPATAQAEQRARDERVLHAQRLGTTTTIVRTQKTHAAGLAIRERRDGSLLR